MPSIPRISSFIVPGAYASVTIRQNIIRIPGGTRIVAVIGPGSPITEVFQRFEGPTLKVSYPPILEQGSGGAGYPDYPNDIKITKNNVILREGTDFTIDAQSGLVTFTTSLVRQDNITCTYTNVQDAEVFFEPIELFRKHGYAELIDTDGDGKVDTFNDNMLALGARVAFENGAYAVAAFSIKDNTYASWATALDVLAIQGGAVTTADFDIVVPMLSTKAPAGPDSTQNGLATHYEVQELCRKFVEFFSQPAERREMMAIFGHPTAETLEQAIRQVLPSAAGGGSVPNYRDIAANFGKNNTDSQDFTRTMYFMPDAAEVKIGDRNVGVHGGVIAAAAAGRFSSFGFIGEPLTFKTLSGFTVPAARRLNRKQQSLLLDRAHVAVIDRNNRVIWGITTDASGSPIREEPSVMAISDYVAQTCRDILEATYIGRPITAGLVDQIGGTTGIILAGLLAQGAIVKYNQPTALQNRIDPRQIDVMFDIMPAFPLNYISIQFSIGLL